MKLPRRTSNAPDSGHLFAGPIWLALLFGVAAAALAPGARAWDRAEVPNEDEEPIERLEQWPELDRRDRKAVAIEIQRVRKARTPEMASEGAAALVALGAGIVPELLPRLATEKTPEARERMEAVLIEVTGAEHTRLLAGSFGEKSRPVRHFCLLRASAFPDEGIREHAEAALEKARALAKKSSRSFDPDDLFLASLASASSGSTLGLDVLAAEAASSWKTRGSIIRSALEGVRGAGATLAVGELIEGADRVGLVAGLNILAGCGTEKDAVSIVRPFLDHTDNSIRIAAINALRGIVDGELPLAKLSVFDAIERARKWKSRV